MNKQNTSTVMSDLTEQIKNIQTEPKKNKSGIDIVKQYLLRKTQNRYKLNLSDEQAFKWKFNQGKDSRPLSSFKLLRKQSKQSKQQSDQFPISLNDLKSQKFPVLNYKNKQLTRFCIMLLQQNSYFRQQIKSRQFLQKLIKQISLNYNIVSYHNFSHAFSLSLMLFQSFEYHNQLKSIYSQQQKFYSILAGLAHDLNHHGTNNAYEIKLKTKLASQFNNQSVLQNYHLRQFWKILQKNPQIDFLKIVKNPIQVKKRISYLILMTDVAQHFKNVEKMKQLQLICQQKKENFFQDEENKQFFLGQLFHACDIGNPCVDFQNYITWAALLSYEFNEQTKLEKENQVEITEMLRYKDLTSFYKGQLGFINFMVMPLWKQIANICTNLTVFTKNINQNINILNQKIQNTKQEDQIMQILKI